jgi:hypothetical protein
MGLKFRRGSTAQQSGSLAFGEPYVNTTLGTLVVGGATGDIVLSAGGTGSTGNFGAISGSGLDITGNANIAGNLTLGGQLTIGDNTSDTVNVVASLSSSLIPQTTNAFDLGSASKIWRDLYISTGSIKFVEGTTVVKTLSAATLTALEASTGSYATTGSNQFRESQTITGSLFISGGVGATTAIRMGDYPNGFNGSIIFDESRINGVVKISSPNGLEVSSFTVAPMGDAFKVDFSSTTVYNKLVASGSTVLGDNSSDLIEISGSLKTNNKATFANQYGTSVEISGGVEINNGFSYPVVIKDNLNVSGSVTLGNSTANTIDISGSLKVKETAFFTKQNGTALEITGGVDINNDTNYPVNIKNTLIVSGAVVLGSNSAYAIEVSGSLKTNNKATFTSQFGTALEVTGGVQINNGVSYPVVIKDNFVVSGSTVLGDNSSDLIEISGSLKSNQKVTFVSPYGVGTALEVTGGVEINNGISYPVTIKDNLVVTGSISGSNIVATTGIYGNIYSTNGVVSGSSQITYASISSIPSGIVSGSSQVTLSSTTGGSTSSNVQFGSLGIGMAATGTSGRIDAANDIVAFSSSDIRFKENITPIENALEKISKISGNTYDWKAENKAEHGYEGNDVGVIAQEVEAVLPQLVQTRESGFKAVKYDKLVALLIEGIKEQQTQIHSLTIEIEKLKESKGL